MVYSSRTSLTVTVGILAAYLSYIIWFKKRRSSKDTEDDSGSSTDPQKRLTEAPLGDKLACVRSTEVCVYYASQTGTSERLAKGLAALLAKWDSIFKPQAVNLEDWKEEDFLGEQAVAIFLVSTHDDGLFPDNALLFVKWLKESIREGRKLGSLSYCIFGLGSTEYPLFNQASKNLQGLLKKLGAHEFVSITMGDEAVDLKRDFSVWKVSLFKSLEDFLGLEPFPLDTKKRTLAVVYNETWRDRASLELRYIDDLSAKQDFEPKVVDVICKQQWQCTDYLVTENVRMTPEGDGQTHCVVLKSEEPFKAAETANVLYANPPDVVEYFVNRLRLREADMEKVITFVPRYGKRGQNETFDAPFPVPCTVKEALVYYLDLTSLPSTEVLSDMGTFLRSPKDCKVYNRLLESEVLLKRMREELSVTLPEFVQMFMPTASLNLGGFLQIVPKKIPKPYTISSHPKTEKVTLTVKLVQHTTHSLKSFKKAIERALEYEDQKVAEDLFRRRRFYKGVCTHFLCSLKAGDLVKIYRRPSAFSITGSLEGRPMVMIANGAGIAPFRAIWQGADDKVQYMLFFGCRDPHHLLYKEEIEGLKRKENFSVHIAFSRAEQHIYVQALVKKHIATIRDVLDHKGTICVCGSKQMGAQVKAILQHFLGMDANKMKDQGNYIEELW